MGPERSEPHFSQTSPAASHPGRSARFCSAAMLTPGVLPRFARGAPQEYFLASLGALHHLRGQTAPWTCMIHNINLIASMAAFVNDSTPAPETGKN